jgi:hypothetical protein
LTVLASSATPASGQVVTGVLAFLVVAGMGVALFFLLRSMNKQLRKVLGEPRWRGEAREGEQPPDGQDGPQGDPEHDFSNNGTPKP